MTDTIAITVTIISAMPPIIVHILTHPYVATITLLLPRAARVSTSALRTFATRPPVDTVLIMQTITQWGLWRNNTVRLASLREVSPARFLHLENYQTLLAQKRMIGTGQKFYVGDAEKGQKLARVPGIWSLLAKVIKENGRIERATM